ncbi:hypothetical protein AX16_000259 [Volvariella volvacea WC 439]|nr:hypothetical protein AX16_000259 [Volvariella volvacea WC 439]
MSWIKDMSGGEPSKPYKEKEEAPKVKDPAIPNRMVVDKPANRPFLAYKEYREKREKLHQDWLKRKEERDAKIARGEPVGPLEPDPTAEEEVGVLGLLKFIFILLLIITVTGKFFTGSFLWEYDGKWVQLKTYMPSGQRLFSERLLAEFDGTVPGKPIYLAIDGDVYDVTSGKAYQPGGSYHILAGVDAARAFATGCFKQHRTHDIRGLSESEMRSINHWKQFYAEHKEYRKIGRVLHPPIDPMSPIPEHCDPKKAERNAKEEKAKREGKKDAKAKDTPSSDSTRNEL